MAIIINQISIPYTNTDNIKQCTKNFICDINVPNSTFNKTRATHSCIEFLRCQEAAPTTTDIVLAEKLFENYSKDIRKNLSELKAIPAIKDMLRENTATIRHLYPKTWNLRKFLINNNRVTLDKVQPALKGLEKLILKLKVSL